VLATQATSLHCFSTRSISDGLCPSQALPHKCFPGARPQIAARLDASHYIVLAMPISASSSCCSENTTMAALAVTLLRRPPEPPQIFKHWHGDRRGLPRQTAPGQGQSITAPLTRSKPCSAPPRLRAWDRGRAATHTCSHSVIALVSRVSMDEIILKRQAHSQKTRPQQRAQPSLDRRRRGLGALTGVDARPTSAGRSCRRPSLFGGNVTEAALVAARGAVHASPGHLPSHGVCSDLPDKARAHAGAGHCA
jgi:hypothetical protein